jgi:hypothetical protein
VLCEERVEIGCTTLGECECRFKWLWEESSIRVDRLREKSEVTSELRDTRRTIGSIAKRKTDGICRLSAMASISNVDAPLALLDTTDTRHLPHKTVAFALGDIVLVWLAICLDFLHACRSRSAIKTPVIEAHTAGLILRLKRGFQEKRSVHEKHRKPIVSTIAGQGLRLDDRGMIELLVAVVVIRYFKDVLNLDIGHEDRAHPVMDPSAWHLPRILPRRWNDDDLATLNSGSALGVFECPEKGAPGPDSVSQFCIRRFQIVVPGVDGLGPQRRTADFCGESQRHEQK